MAEAAPARASTGYQLFMLVLCVYAIAAIAIERTVHLEPETRGVLEYADHVVCALFFVDFLNSLVRAPNRWRYFVTWGWLDLLSSIPTVDATRIGRAARIVRVFRVLRGLRATKLLARLLLERRAENAFLAASLVAMLLLVFSSIAVLHFEDLPESNIKTAEDAVWWAFVTITTVGYGDRYPLTTEGRVVAGILMSAGVGLFGTFSGFVAAWFVGSRNETEAPATAAELRALRSEVAELKALLQDRGVETRDRLGQHES